MSANDSAFKMAVMWHMVEYIPRLRKLERREIHQVAKDLSAISGEQPLHMLGGQALFEVPLIEPGKKLTGPETAAVMVGALWVLQGEDPDMCSSLTESWPISDALFLIDGHDSVFVRRNKIHQQEGNL